MLRCSAAQRLERQLCLGQGVLGPVPDLLLQLSVCLAIGMNTSTDQPNNLFSMNFCDMTCRPDHSNFLKPKIIRGNTTEKCSSIYPPGEEHDMVESIEYYMKDSFKNGLFDSCKNVYNPSTGIALGLMCGEWGIYCTPERWFGKKTA